jgi:2-keto-4-pentenoate hydratase/2-oxohepta-3-ene-1,7-dioic acid hydratase in catechol pathway
MQLMRIGPAGGERPVVRAGAETCVDVSDVVTDFDGAWFPGGPARLGEIAADRVAAGRVTSFGDERIGAPIARPHQVLCIGLNYRDHAAETGQATPDEPIVFNKAANTLVGTYGPVRRPRGSTKLDWEVELGIVIGERASYLADEQAASPSAWACGRRRTCGQAT